MSHPTSLETVKQQFDHWRKHKKSPQLRVPNDLRAQAVALRTQYKDQEIIRALKLNEKRFSQWSEEFPPATPPSCVNTDFVELPMLELEAEPSIASEPNKILFTGTLHNGIQWQLQGDFPPEYIAKMLGLLAAHAGANT